MSTYSEIKKVTTETLRKMKFEGEKITMLTSYDFTTAKMVDAGGVDAILVGDSASNVMAGHETTLPITLDQMIYHTQSVVRGVSRALVVADLPFGTRENPSLASSTWLDLLGFPSSSPKKMDLSSSSLRSACFI